MPVAPGTRLGSYELLTPIGAGGMGEVWKARDLRLDRMVAIKVLSGDTAGDPHASERLHREALAAAALDHPFICKVFEIGEHTGENGETLFLVMEYIAGETLSQRLRLGRIPVPDAIRIAGEIGEALEEAHAHGILHRDLKPANIMLTGQGHVKILDFGLARRFANVPTPSELSTETTSLTSPGTIVGTPEYMSPEQLKDLNLDARSDLFSFGVILAEMISGRHPFRKTSRAETLAAVIGGAPDFGTDIPRGRIVQGLIVMVRRMLAKAFDDRYGSISDVRADLARLVSTSPNAGRDEEGDHGQRTNPIGRDAELRDLIKLLDEALRGHGSLILIGGEPGIGKTHLASALLDAARLRGAWALRGHCYDLEGTPPYSPFIEHLESCARDAPRDAFRYALGDDAPEVARLMPELRRMFPDIPAATELPPEHRRRFLFNAYREFAERSARVTPIVALFEDLQWADESTLLLLQHLAQAVEGMPILLVGTYRDVDLQIGQPLARTLESLLRLNLGTRILLRRLSLAGVERMLKDLSSQQPPPSLTRVVFNATEGNPFFIEEVFRHLAEEGKLFDDKGAFLSHLSADLRVDELRVPQGVRLVLGRRLERLTRQAQQILPIAAVIGRIFPLELLEELDKARPDEVLEALEEAERASLVEADVAGSQTRYRFVHELVRQTLAERLSLPRRRRLHALVADALERLYSSSLEAHVATLAHHLYHAGAAADREKTIHFLSEAAKRASAAAAHEEALEHLNNALSLLEDENNARVADLRTRRAIVLRSLTQHKDVVREFERALAIYHAIGDHVRFVQTSVPLWSTLFWAGQFREAHAVTERAAQEARQASAPERCEALAMQSLSIAAAGEIDKGLDLIEDLHGIPEHELTPGAVGLACACEMYVRFGAAQDDLSETAARKGSSIFQEAGDVWWQAEIEIGLLFAPVRRGRPAETERLARQFFARAERIGHDSVRFLALVYLSIACINKGDLEQAERTAVEARALGESCHIGWTFVAEVLLGTIVLYRGKTEESISLLTKAGGGAVPFQGYSEGARARATAMAGSPSAAGACAAAMRHLPTPGISRSMGGWHAVLCLIEALSLDSRREESARLQDAAEHIAAEWDCNDFGFPARTAVGIALASAGNWARAEEHHRAAISRMDEVPYVTAQPIARYWYADMLVERGGPADIRSAKALLQETIAATDAIGLALYGGLARHRLAQIELHPNPAPLSRAAGSRTDGSVQ
jgi:serine/threonine protein kinase/tetratricopeptide (TPR) repeat protein